MIKIDRQLKNKSSSFVPTQSLGRIPVQDVSQKKDLFLNEIKTSHDFQIQSEINDLIEQLDQNGKQFAENPNADNLRIYKRDIQSFLHYVTKHSYTIKEVFGRRIDYKIVNTINAKLEELSTQVMTREALRIDLLAKIDEIRGLIVDLIL